MCMAYVTWTSYSQFRHVYQLQRAIFFLSLNRVFAIPTIHYDIACVCARYTLYDGWISIWHNWRIPRLRVHGDKNDIYILRVLGIHGLNHKPTISYYLSKENLSVSHRRAIGIIFARTLLRETLTLGFDKCTKLQFNLIHFFTFFSIFVMLLLYCVLSDNDILSYFKLMTQCLQIKYKNLKIGVS